MARFKRGDRVTVVSRPVTPADRKSGLYYPHFSGLRGVVDQIYEAEGEVCIEVDQDSLPPDFLRRQQGIESQARQKWLNGLSEQERRSLSEEQKQLRLKYTVLVGPDDVSPESGRARRAAAAPQAEPAQVSAAAAPERSGAAAQAALAPRRAEAAQRRGEADLSAAEEAHLQELLRRATKQ